MYAPSPHPATSCYCPLYCLPQVTHPGYIVPPRPNRNALEGARMQARFIEERSAGCHRFLNKLAVHPVLGDSEVRGEGGQQAGRASRAGGL